MKQIKLALGMSLLGLMLLYSAPPLWWVERGVTEAWVDESSHEILKQNHSAVMQGQLMNIAKHGADEITLKYQGGMGEELEGLLASFQTYSTENSYSTVSDQVLNFKAINVGQLKTIAKPFYDRLWEIENAWPGAVSWPVGIEFQSEGKYPWPETTPENLSENYTLANIGQVKFLFSWELNKDSDNDGIPDWWEIHYGLDPNDPTDANLPFNPNRGRIALMSASSTTTYLSAYNSQNLNGQIREAGGSLTDPEPEKPKPELAKFSLSIMCVCHSGGNDSECNFELTLHNNTVSLGSNKCTEYDESYCRSEDCMQSYTRGELIVALEKGATYDYSVKAASSFDPQGNPRKCPGFFMWLNAVNDDSSSTVVYYKEDDYEFTLPAQDEVTGKLTVFDFEFVTPKQLKPNEKITKANRTKSGEGQNAYVFNSENDPRIEYRGGEPNINPAKFEMDIKVKVYPENHGLSDQAIKQAFSGLYFDLDINENIEKKWTYQNNQSVWYEGGFLRARVECWRLPPRNKHFGTKDIKLIKGRDVLVQSKFQMFYNLRGAETPLTYPTFSDEDPRIQFLRPSNLVLYYSDALGYISVDDDGTGYSLPSGSKYSLTSSDANGYNSRTVIGSGRTILFTAGILEENKMDVEFYRWYGNDYIKNLSFMQLFAYAFDHETDHVEIFTSWWGTCDNYYEKYRTEDCDFDLIPDKLEYYLVNDKYVRDVSDEEASKNEMLNFKHTQGEKMIYKRETRRSYGVDKYDDLNHFANSRIPLRSDMVKEDDWGSPGSQYNE